MFNFFFSASLVAPTFNPTHTLSSHVSPSTNQSGVGNIQDDDLSDCESDVETKLDSLDDTQLMELDRGSPARMMEVMAHEVCLNFLSLLKLTNSFLDTIMGLF